MIDFECSTCGREMHVPESAAGKTGTCKTCGTSLIVPSQPIIIERTARSAVSTTRVNARRRPPEQTLNSVVQVNVHQPIRYSNSMGVASVVLGILALMICWIPLVGLLGTPLAALGLLLGTISIVLALFRGGVGLGFGIAGSAISLLSLVVVISFHMAINAVVSDINEQVKKAERNRPRPANRPLPGNAVPPIGNPNPVPQPEVPANPWDNAGSNAKDDLVSVDFTGASIGKVDLETIGREGESEDNLLKIELSIANLSDTKKLNYGGWGSRDFGLRNGASLEDDLGNHYAKINFGISKVKGQQTSESLYPEKSVTDVLVFETPIEKAAFLYLTLPRSVYAGTFTRDEDDVLRLKIPTAEIRR